MSYHISVDVQPEYREFIHFDLSKYFKWLNRKENVLYLYNGESTTGMINEENLKDFIWNQYPSDTLIEKLQFYDKGYSFFRDAMDFNIPEEDIVFVAKQLVGRNFRSADEITEFDRTSITQEGLDFFETKNYSFYIPEVGGRIHSFCGGNKVSLTGGAAAECLREVELLIKAMDIKKHIIKKWVY